MARQRDSWLRRLPAALVAVLGLAAASCRDDGGGKAPERTAAEVIAAHSAELMAIPGVTGVYEGESHGQTVLRVMVYARADSTYRRIPRRIEGYRVEIEVSGSIRPYH